VPREFLTTMMSRPALCTIRDEKGSSGPIPLMIVSLIVRYPLGLIEQGFGDRSQDRPIRLKDLDIVPTDIGDPISASCCVERFICRTFSDRIHLRIEREVRPLGCGKRTSFVPISLPPMLVTTMSPTYSVARAFDVAIVAGAIATP
jgi:hypothetical protein